MKKQASARRANPAHHGHEAGRCLDVLRQLSAYIDDELPGKICDELRRHLGACPNCEDFVASLRDTVTLCRHRPTPTLTAADRAALRLEILRAAQARSHR
ncbi:MAG TPA: zf-HC2 domain-containing protein [Nitrospira sp.]|nr:zf-HC2 domain-containing protein [Nitrospira sp.]